MNTPYTTLRIIDSRGYCNGEWLCEPDNKTRIAYVERVYREHVAEEPDSGWRLQTRGTSGIWHDFNS